MSNRVKPTEHSRDMFVKQLKEIGFTNARKIERGRSRKPIVDREKLIVK